MATKISVLLLSQSGTRLNALEDSLMDYQGLSATRKLLSSSTRHPLAELNTTPDVIVLDLGEDWESELLSVADDSSLQPRPPLIVIGNSDDSSMMRRAMQAGARDFFTGQIDEEELIGSIRQIGREAQLNLRQNTGTVTAVINGKGGSGTTMLVSNLAVWALGGDKKNPNPSAIIDMDMQFGDVPVYFDLPSNDNLNQALVSAGNLDSLAIDGLVEVHPSSVSVLASKPEQIRSIDDSKAQAVTSLISAFSQNFDHVLLDLPRTMSPEVIAALECSDQVVIVTQQSVPHIRDTRYLLSLIRELGLSNDSIHVVVNKYDKKSEVRLSDVQDVFPELDVYPIPTDDKRVNYSVNNGIPVTLRWPKIPVSKAVKKLADILWPDLKNGGKNRSGK